MLQSASALLFVRHLVAIARGRMDSMNCPSSLSGEVITTFRRGPAANDCNNIIEGCVGANCTYDCLGATLWLIIGNGWLSHRLSPDLGTDTIRRLPS